MVEATDETVENLKRISDGPVDLREVMQRMTLEIAGRTMFSFGMDRHGAALRDFVMDYGDRLARPLFLEHWCCRAIGRRRGISRGRVSASDGRPSSAC